jgi:uncharacterized glyoxalase superfamily protein PhnB
MKLIPLFKVTDMRAAIRHYTEVLDFVMTWPEDTPDSAVVDLGHEETELQLTTDESDKLFGSVVNIWVNDVDALFAKYMSRGLNTSGKSNSPVHMATAGHSSRSPLLTRAKPLDKVGLIWSSQNE